MGKSNQEILQKYYNEAVGGIVNKTPSALNRGEGTEIEYFIYKIDLVASTLFTKNRAHSTYLKLAHTFLSAVDEITRDFGAEEGQTEYAGDSVIAYFRIANVKAIDVLNVAGRCRSLALDMKNLDRTLGGFPFLTKTVIHCGKLIMAKIGPRGNWVVSAIGPELHKACKMESKVRSGESLVSKAFYEKLDRKHRSLLKANTIETKVLKEVPPPPPSTPRSLLAEALYPTMAINRLVPQQADPLRNTLLGMSSGALNLNQFSTNLSSIAGMPQYETKIEVENYSIKWKELTEFMAYSNG